MPTKYKKFYMPTKYKKFYMHIILNYENKKDPLIASPLW